MDVRWCLTVGLTYISLMTADGWASFHVLVGQHDIFWLMDQNEYGDKDEKQIF